MKGLEPVRRAGEAEQRHASKKGNYEPELDTEAKSDASSKD